MNYLPFVWLLAGLAGCATQSMPKQQRALSDGAEFYVPNETPGVVRKRLLADPINGLGEANDPSIRVMDIRLTSSYTILYMTFSQQRQSGNYGMGSSTISIQPEAKLMTPDGSRKFALIRAEGIPLTPGGRDVNLDERIDFVLYFERLSKGIEEFGMFECTDTPTTTCWNVRAMHIQNAADSTDNSIR